MQLAQLDFYQYADGQLPGVKDAVSPEAGFAGFLSGIIQAVMVIGALLVLFYLMWGAITWITSGGEKGQIEKARNKMTQAIIGLVVLASSLAIFIMLQRFLGIEVLKFTDAPQQIPSTIKSPGLDGTTTGKPLNGKNTKN